MKMNDLMLDLETMGTSHRAAIVQLGACYFDRHTGETGDYTCVNIDLEAELAAGFTVDASTVYWWLQQSDAARESISMSSGENPINQRGPFKEKIKFLNAFLKNAKNIWSHATFDFVILMNHYEKLNVKPSFHYRAARDLRTLDNLANIDPKSISPREGTHHNALDDCRYQIKYAVECFKKLKSEELNNG